MNLVDTGFVLVCSALVFLMTPGLAFFYGGLGRPPQHADHHRPRT